MHSLAPTAGWGCLVSEGRRKGPMELWNCGAVPLRPQQSTVERGSPHSYCPHPPQQPNELMLPQKQERPGVGARGRQAARAWLGVRLPTRQGHREGGLVVGGHSQGPQRVSKSLETGRSRWPHTRTQHPELRCYKWKCILRGAGPEQGFSEVTHHWIKIQTAFKC